jgi:hypothetical protein
MISPALKLKMFSLHLALSLAPIALVLAVPNVKERSGAADPCVKVAGQAFSPPADALACMKTFPFNETIRQNVIATGRLNTLVMESCSLTTFV